MSTPRESISVPALDLKSQYAAIRDEIDAAVRRVIASQMFVQGPEVEQLEAEVADYCGAARGVGCASGTDALLVPLMAAGIGPGDEAITTPYSFVATAASIWRTGARPVFVDIDPDTYNLDPARIEEAVTPRTRAIVPVHLFGQTADMDPIRQIARRFGLFVLEDAAQAIGASYRGCRAGCLGQAASFSFYPSKNLGGFGDGGMMTTDDRDFGRVLARLRVHGMEPKYHHREVGINSRLDALQAAVLRVKLRHLDVWTARRRQVAGHYRVLFHDAGLDDVVGLPVERPGHFHVYNQFVIRVPAPVRDPLREHLASRQVATEIYYPGPLHLQPCFAPLGHRPGAFPRAEAAAQQTLALPIYPELTEEQQHHVVAAIRQFVDRTPRGAGAVSVAAVTDGRPWIPGPEDIGHALTSA
jgi:dTDP-4-amino-4,6-dideoxygalactose transaminase